MEPLTKRQRDVYEAIKAFVREHRYGPTRAEVARAAGMRHVSGVDWHLKTLVRKNWITMRHDSPRAIALLWEDIPVIGLEEIAPNESIVRAGRVQFRLPTEVTGAYPKTPDLFVILEDTSMNGIGLGRGTFVGIDVASQAKDGEVVLVRYGGKLMLRRYREGSDGLVELHPESTDRRYRPIRVDPNDSTCVIEGVAIKGFGSVEIAALDPKPDEADESAE